MSKPQPENPAGAERPDLDQQLSKIEALKKDFDAEFSKSEKSGNFERTLELKKQIDENLAALKARAAAEEAFREAKQVETIEPELPEQQFEMAQEFTLTIGAKTGEQYQQEITDQGYKVSDITSDLLDHPDFNKSQPAKSERIKLTRLTVTEIATRAGPVFTEALKKSYLTTPELFEAAKIAGLDLAPASVGPELRLAYKDQPLNEWIHIGMQPIADRDGNPAAFEVGHNSGGVWLSTEWARPDSRWDPGIQVVFRVRT
jgi:hypothetical protein